MRAPDITIHQLNTNGKQSLFLPRRPRGRPTAATNAQYFEDRAAFAAQLLELRSRLDFTPGVRGWCYLLEPFGLSKGDFDKAEALITECRKLGLLPLDFTAEDPARGFLCEEDVTDCTPERWADVLTYRAAHGHKGWLPFSLWDAQDCYVQMLVEKVDLVQLFLPICRRYHIPIANAKGSGDIHVRAAMMRRFQYWEAHDKRCVLLYCGDFDPAGLRIFPF
jgi:hypothetical protein